MCPNFHTLFSGMREAVQALKAPERLRQALDTMAREWPAERRMEFQVLFEPNLKQLLIPEYVPVITSVTTGRPEELETPIGRFLFRHVAPGLFFGFTEVEVSPSQTALIATPRKALVDLLYLTPHSDDADLLRELRLERPDGFDLEALHATVRRCGSAKVERAVRKLMLMWSV